MQVWRWAQQYRTQLTGPPLPEMARLVAWLQAHVPGEDADPAHTRISHGDFRFEPAPSCFTSAGDEPENLNAHAHAHALLTWGCRLVVGCSRQGHNPACSCMSVEAGTVP